MSASTERVGAGVVLDALAGSPDPELRRALGPAGGAALDAALRGRALAWARRAGGGADPLEAGAVAELDGLLAGHAGPVFLVAPDVPGLSEHHLTGAREDLAAGVLLSSASAGDGSPFLVALSRPDPELVALVGAPFPTLAAAAARLGRALGMLRAERRLATLADARALRADPLAPPPLRALLDDLAP